MRSGDLVSWCGSGVLNHWLFWTSPCASMPFVHVFGSRETCRNQMLHLSKWIVIVITLTLEHFQGAVTAN